MTSAQPPETAVDVTRLKVVDLTCVRGERCLFRNLSFSLDNGQCLHLRGANGSGKTSLLRILCGLRQADDGAVLWEGSRIDVHADFRRDLAYLGHKDGLKDALTTHENLLFYQALVGHQDQLQLDRILARLGLLECADLPASQLSFGQRRRLAFARLLLQSKPLWVLDEPFTGIDHEGRALIESLCLEQLDGGGLIVLTNHRSLSSSTLAPTLHEVAL